MLKPDGSLSVCGTYDIEHWSTRGGSPGYASLLTCKDAAVTYAELHGNEQTFLKSGGDSWTHYTKFGKAQGYLWPGKPCSQMIKPGNNGTVSCETYCRGHWAGGPKGRCISGSVDGLPERCDTVAAARDGQLRNVVCTCEL